MCCHGFTKLNKCFDSICFQLLVCFSFLLFHLLVVRIKHLPPWCHARIRAKQIDRPSGRVNLDGDQGRTNFESHRIAGGMSSQRSFLSLCPFSTNPTICLILSKRFVISSSMALNNMITRTRPTIMYPPKNTVWCIFRGT